MEGATLRTNLFIGSDAQCAPELALVSRVLEVLIQLQVFKLQLLFRLVQWLVRYALRPA
jgi:hypothetical protein